jgi:uncharacterized protein (DUF2249 family)
LQHFKDSDIGARQSRRMQPSELDVCPLPYWQRLPSILQALDRLAPGEAIDLVVDLDPWPLRTYLDAWRPGRCDWQTLAAGPTLWRVRVRRVA